MSKILTLMFHDGLGVVELLLLRHHILEGEEMKSLKKKKVDGNSTIQRLPSTKFLPWRFFRILFALCISFLHSAIFSCAEVMFCSAK